MTEEVDTTGNGWRNIPISLIEAQKGEGKTQDFDIAWFRQTTHPAPNLLADNDV